MEKTNEQSLHVLWLWLKEQEWQEDLLSSTRKGKIIQKVECRNQQSFCSCHC